ncbi:transposase [Ferdinandcohnia sp. Marseille-Q9671]
MAKFSAEDKLQAVKRYLNGSESSSEIAKSLGTDHKAILKWLKQYEYSGIEAFTFPNLELLFYFSDFT